MSSVKRTCTVKSFWYRTQYILDRRRRKTGGRVAQGESRRPRPGGARCGESTLTRATTKRRRSTRERRLFVLDTNVLMHDPAAIFRFEEHNIYLPMVVLEELDAHKKACRRRRATSAKSAAFSTISCAMRLANRSRVVCPCQTTCRATTAKSRAAVGCSSRRNSSALNCPTICRAKVTTTPSLRKPWRYKRCIRMRASSSSQGH